MNHEYYEELISARLDGLLTEEEERELDAHLASCPDCRRARREMDTVHRMLLAASPLPPEGLEDRILDDLPNQPRRRSPWMKKAAPLAAAAVFLLAVVGITKTVANFHSSVNQDVVQAESVTEAEESEAASDSAKTEGARDDKEDKDSVGAFGKEKEEETEAKEAEEAAEEAAEQKPAAASSQDQSKAKTTTQSKDKKTSTARTETKKTDTANAAETKPVAAETRPAETQAAAQEAEPAAIQHTESKTEAPKGSGSAAAAGAETPAEAAEAEEAAEAPAAPAPEPAAGAAVTQADAAPEPEDEDPEAPAASGSTLTWQQARDRLDAYLDGTKDDLAALGMDSSGTHWLFSTGGKTYAVDIHTGAVSQR